MRVYTPSEKWVTHLPPVQPHAGDGVFNLGENMLAPALLQAMASAR
ncbi:hypothetical protein [Sodalis-like endosymbiont of Proechinophthirus fluctus]|nr:hypothetical protein [Sodalis-like endosymbiont of Proechinophthirus fluctus]